MTFTEAAVEVLRLVGKPLHYKKITEIAIERNLLSHVGKTPETTMSSRLSTMVKKDRGDAPILKIKPGVFGLREFSEDVLEAAVDDAGTEVDKKDLAKADAKSVEAETKEESAEAAAPAEERSVPGSEIFPEEEDDDELIFSNLGEGEEPASRSRRKRTRRSRDRGAREARNGTKDSRRSAGSARGSSTGRNRKRGETSRRKSVEGDWNRAAKEGESLGGDLSDAVVNVLGGRRRTPASYQELAEALIESGRLEGDPALLGPTLAAAVRGENARRIGEGRQPRFRERGVEVSLTHWDIPSEAARAEKDAERAAHRQRDVVRRTFVKRLRDLPDASLIELLATWLNAAGVSSIRGVSAEVGDFDLGGVIRRGPEEVPLAIAVFKGNRPITRDHVIALRGGLHRFGNARSGWLISLGQIHAEAQEEASSEGAAPCALYDAVTLAQAMEEVGIGLKRFSVPLSMLDVALLESLEGGEARASSSRRRRSRGDDDVNASEDAEGQLDTSEDASSEASSSGRRRRSRRRPRRRRSENGAEAESTGDEAQEVKSSSEESVQNEASEPEPSKDVVPPLSEAATEATAQTLETAPEAPEPT